MSAIYRVQQFARAAGAWVRPARRDEARIGRYLEPAAARLFGAMPRYDRRHALAVLDALEGAGYHDPDLLAAALLHDAGKTLHPEGRLYLWHRVAAVLMRALWPGLLERLGRERHRGLRRAFFVQQHHAELGAELALQAGCSDRTAALIRLHEEPARRGDDRLLVALRDADSVN
ncbi:MAG: HD domain-containing protein [Anaerolineae bacterium]|jgi:hypothetical protein